MKPILIIAGGGALLYYLYSKGYFGGLSTTTTPVSSAPPTTTPPPVTTTPPVTTPPPPSYTLQSIYNAMVADAQAPAAGLSAWGWEYSLNRVYPSQPAPDPYTLTWPNGDPTQPMTAAQFWSVVGPYYGSHFGLTGIGGLNGYGHAVPVGWA